MIIISDTTAITNLYQIGLLEIIRQIYGEIIIPIAVYQELAQNSDQKKAIDEADWIKVLSIKDKKLYKRLLEKLDFGEAEAIALAKELHSDLLIMDEYAGRTVAKEYNLKIIGVLGILTVAKKKGLIQKV